MSVMEISAIEFLCWLPLCVAGLPAAVALASPLRQGRVHEARASRNCLDDEHGRRAGPAFMKNGVPYTCSESSTAIECPGVSGTPCAPTASRSSLGYRPPAPQTSAGQLPN